MTPSRVATSSRPPVPCSNPLTSPSRSPTRSRPRRLRPPASRGGRLHAVQGDRPRPLAGRHAQVAAPRRRRLTRRFASRPAVPCIAPPRRSPVSGSAPVRRSVSSAMIGAATSSARSRASRPTAASHCAIRMARPGRCAPSGSRSGVPAHTVGCAGRSSAMSRSPGNSLSCSNRLPNRRSSRGARPDPTERADAVRRLNRPPGLSGRPSSRPWSPSRTRRRPRPTTAPSPPPLRAFPAVASEHPRQPVADDPVRRRWHGCR